MTATSTSQSAGLEAAFLQNRERLLQFLLARGAGDAAEDLLQDVWMKIANVKPGPVSSPLSYLYRAADTLMIDRYRSRRQAERRDRDWSELTADTVTGISDAPSADRQFAAKQLARLVEQLLDGLEPPRVGQIFRRHRVDGIPQRQIAEEFGVSLSTVESDLRRAYRALSEIREKLDEV